LPSDYFTLISSLPHMPQHFDVDRAPITRPRLMQRLKMVEPSDARDLHAMTDFLSWDRQVIEKADQEVVADYERLKSEIQHPIVLELLEHRVNIRTIVGALRRRRRDEGPPIGVGELVAPIRRNWKEPQFGLHCRFPWIERFSELMKSGQALEADRILQECSWTKRSRMADDYTFSFEAVLLYLARWSIIDRWTTRDSDAGLQRFEQIIEETLGEYAALQF
jgi:hypothetical protein